MQERLKIVAGVVRNSAARLLRKLQEHRAVRAGRRFRPKDRRCGAAYSWPTSAIPRLAKITLAQRGALLSDGPNKLRFHLEDGTQQESIPKVKDQYSITTFDNTEIPITLPSDESAPRDLLPVAELSLHALLQQCRARACGGGKRPQLRIRAALQLLTSFRARYYEIEFHRRFALPTACLVLAMVGIPLGLSARKGGKSTGFVLTILLVIVYYIFSLTGVHMARQARLSPWFGSWMGNGFFFVCGLISAMAS